MMMMMMAPPPPRPTRPLAPRPRHRPRTRSERQPLHNGYDDTAAVIAVVLRGRRRGVGAALVVMEAEGGEMEGIALRELGPFGGGCRKNVEAEGWVGVGGDHVK
jgi:hypothetical protein